MVSTYTLPMCHGGASQICALKIQWQKHLRRKEGTCLSQNINFPFFSELTKDTVSKRCYANNRVWIGYTKLDSDTYGWSDHSPNNYTNWYDAEPNNLHHNESCAQMLNTATCDIKKNGKWNDFPCVVKMNFVCKKQAPPSKQW